jgi:hypothetical protein
MNIIKSLYKKLSIGHIEVKKNILKLYNEYEKIGYSQMVKKYPKKKWLFDEWREQMKK